MGIIYNGACGGFVNVTLTSLNYFPQNSILYFTVECTTRDMAIGDLKREKATALLCFMLQQCSEKVILLLTLAIPLSVGSLWCEAVSIPARILPFLNSSLAPPTSGPGVYLVL